MAYHNEAAWKILQVLFKNLERLYVKVICRLVKNKEVGILHQHRAQIQFPSFATTQLINVIMLLFWSEQEVL